MIAELFSDTPTRPTDMVKRSSRGTGSEPADAKALYKCPYCVALFYKDGWEKAKKHIAERHTRGKRKKKNGLRTGRWGSAPAGVLLDAPEEVSYLEEAEITPVLA